MVVVLRLLLTLTYISPSFVSRLVFRIQAGELTRTHVIPRGKLKLYSGGRMDSAHRPCHEVPL